MCSHDPSYPSLSFVDPRSESLCLQCFKPRTNHRSLKEVLREDPLCGQCRSALPHFNRVVRWNNLTIYGLYRYEASLSHLLVQFKDHQDFSLAPCFIWPYRDRLKRFMRTSYAIYTPSSHAKTQVRGYFPLEALYRGLNRPIHHHFIKEDVEQKHRSPKERALIHQQIHLHTPLPARLSTLTLVEDVITTGSTLQAMVDQLRPYKLPIRVVCIAIHPLWLEKSLNF